MMDSSRQPAGFRQRNVRTQAAREAGLAWARAWRIANMARFDAMDAAGMFIDSAPPVPAAFGMGLRGR